MAPDNSPLKNKPLIAIQSLKQLRLCGMGAAVEIATPADRLYYREPAPYWQAALPLANGRPGLMVHGGGERERLAPNEDSLW